MLLFEYLDINIHIKGAADTCWAVDKQVLNNEGKYEDENQTVTGYEEYFNAKYYLLGSASGTFNSHFSIRKLVYERFKDVFFSKS